MPRITGVLAFTALFALPLAAQAAPYQFFHYKNAKGLSRICRGDTASGEAICADGTAVWAETKGDAAPSWETLAKAKNSYLRYRSPFEKPGAYAFFAYNNKSNDARVCVGDTASGEVRCADAASHFATAAGAAAPTWELDDKAKVTVLRYFPGGKLAKAGTYSFGPYYSNKGEVRLCQLETTKGVATCVDSTTTAATRVGEGKLGDWDVSKTAKLTHFQYFQQL